MRAELGSWRRHWSDFGMTLDRYEFFQHALFVGDLQASIEESDRVSGAGPFVISPHHRTDSFDYRRTGSLTRVPTSREQIHLLEAKLFTRTSGSVRCDGGAAVGMVLRPVRTDLGL